MMSPDESEPEGLTGVPSDVFDDRNSSVSSLGGWASAGAGVGNALFAVTKGVSSRVEGVSSRMTMRAKDILASSMGEDEGRSSDGAHAASRNGEVSSSAEDSEKNEVLRLASTLGSPVKLAEKVIAMSKLSSKLGGAGGAKRQMSRDVLRSVAEPLVLLLGDAEHFDPFFANACVGCAHKVLQGQGSDFAEELVNVGAAEAVIPLLDPRFELTRIETSDLLEKLLRVDHAGVSGRVVGYPRGMQALVDLLDDNYDEVRQQGVALLEAFLTRGSKASALVDLQNFVAFQEGFERLFNVMEQATEETSLLALRALHGAVVGNALSRKLFVSGGHLSRLSPLLMVDHVQMVDVSSLASGRSRGVRAGVGFGNSRGDNGGRRRWSWSGQGGGGKSNGDAEARQDAIGGEGGPAAQYDGQPGFGVYDGSPASLPAANGGGSSGNGVLASGANGWHAAEGERRCPTERISVTLALISALVDAPKVSSLTGSGCGDDVEKPSLADTAASSLPNPGAYGVRGIVGREEKLVEAICELAMGSHLGRARGAVPMWADYGLPVECQREAVVILATLISGNAENQARFAECRIRGAPFAVSVEGRTELVRGKPRLGIDSVFAQWLAVSSEMEAVLAEEKGEEEGGEQSEASEKRREYVVTEMALLDMLLDAFLLSNWSWSRTVLTGVAEMHAADAASTSRFGSLMAAATSFQVRRRGIRARRGRATGRGAGGVAIMSDVLRKALLASSPGTLGGDAEKDGPELTESKRGAAANGADKEAAANANANAAYESGKNPRAAKVDGDDDPLTAAINVRLLRRVLQAGGKELRALASAIGVATEGAGRREERLRRAQAVAEGGRVELGTNEGGESLEGSEAGGVSSAYSRSGEFGGDGEASEGGEEGAQRCAPPLTPALEVAVRLFADGYNVAIMVQEGMVEGGEGRSASPPLDLTRYLVSLGELLVAWVSRPGAGSSLPNRLLASGANWSLLRTFGRALGTTSKVPDRRGRTDGEVNRVNAVGKEQGIGDAVLTPPATRSRDYMLAYLHALVAVTLGSFLAYSDGVIKRTLSAGIVKHVGLLPFCRALDAAADWVAFAEGGQEGSVPFLLALAGDPAFSQRMLEVTRDAQMATIEMVVGISRKDLSLRDRGSGISHPTGSRSGHDRDQVNGKAMAVGEAERPTGNGVHDGGVSESGERKTGPPPGDSGAYTDLLLRQEARIRDLEDRLRGRPAAGTQGGARAEAEGSAVTPVNEPKLERVPTEEHDSPISPVRGAKFRMTI